MHKPSSFFVALLLPYLAVGKGKNDGSNGDNAVTTTLMDTDKYRLDIHTYNASSADISEFHGDLELQIKTGAISNQEFGFCFKGDDKTWDCMSVMTNLDPEKITDINNDPDYETKFMIQDGFTQNGDIVKTKTIEPDLD